MVVKVRRFDPSTGRTRYVHYDVKPRPGLTVLSALFYIRERLDDSLAFRYSCRGAVCGTCAMLINKVPRLACRTQVKALLQGEGKLDLTPYPAIEPDPKWRQREEVLVEPLPHLHVIKDLVVDMRRFFQFYRAVQPALKAHQDLPAREMRLDPVTVKELEKYTNCILCAACHGACPVVARNPDFLGPAALAKLYRFAIDPREGQDDSRLLLANQPEGWWACRFFNNCRKVCPKGVPPNFAIGSARQELEKSGKAPEKRVEGVEESRDQTGAAESEIQHPSVKPQMTRSGDARRNTGEHRVYPSLHVVPTGETREPEPGPEPWSEAFWAFRL